MGVTNELFPNERDVKAPDACGPVPPALLLPRDALFEMEFQLGTEISMISDPTTLQVMLRLLKFPNAIIRRDALDAVRAMHSMESAPSLLSMLDDPVPDNAYEAVRVLAELAGEGIPNSRTPQLPEFRQNPSAYTANFRVWWEAEGKGQATQRAAQRAGGGNGSR
jgi:hypothetical protein